MKRSLLGTRLPEGMKDLLPSELALQEKLEKNILDLFSRWSFRKVLTPTLEFRSCVQPDPDREDNLYKFFDQQGHILALRPELTIPIARLVSTRLRGEPLPMRLCYAADVYRNSQMRHREFRQAGVELLGSSNEMADAEVIALSIESIKCLDIKNFQFNLGHMGIFLGLMSETGIDKALRVQVEDALARKDIVKIEMLVAQSKLPQQVQKLILRLPRLHGGEEILDEILTLSQNEKLREAVESLRQVYMYLEKFGVKDYVALDLGILRGFSYYTGVIFEGYVSGIGFPAVEGGRYDLLYDDFQYPLAATGFAINLGSLLELFPQQIFRSADVLVYGKSEQKIISYCQELRKQGKKVEMALEIYTKQEAEKLAAHKNIPSVYCIDEV